MLNEQPTRMSEEDVLESLDTVKRRIRRLGAALQDAALVTDDGYHKLTPQMKSAYEEVKALELSVKAVMAERDFLVDETERLNDDLAGAIGELKDIFDCMDWTGSEYFEDDHPAVAAFREQLEQRFHQDTQEALFEKLLTRLHGRNVAMEDVAALVEDLMNGVDVFSGQSFYVLGVLVEEMQAVSG